jgi:hypothetical protein
VTAIGVSTPIRILPIGSFPMDSSVLTIKGVFKVWGYNRHPSRILTNTDDVRMIELRYTATGETVFIDKINLTLLGTIATDQLTCYLKDEWNNVLTGDLTFDMGTRRLLIDAPAGGWRIDKTWSDRQIYVYFNIQGFNGDSVGVRVDTEEDTSATTEISGDTINPVAPSGEPIPPTPTIKTLASSGTVYIDRYGSTTLPTRAGTYSYQRRWLYRCYGEPIDFMSITVTLGGTIPYDRVTGMRIRIYSSYPVAQSYDVTQPFLSDGTSTFQRAVPTTPLWTVSMDTNFYGYIYIDSYVYLDHGNEGMTVYTGLAAAASTVCEGQVTTTAITVQPWGGGDIPTWSYTRTINGQLYVHGTSLIPDPLVDSSQNIPVHKLTFNAEGQRVRVNSIQMRKLGTVAMNQVTVRIYYDVNNDTTTSIQGDDVELDPSRAGNFVDNRITFLPNFWVTPGLDYNVLIVFSLGLGTAGWVLGSRCVANEVGTSTDTPNWASAYPNECLNLLRNPPLIMDSLTVPIRDRGNLTVYPEDLSPLAPIEDGVYSWMKFTFWAEGENVDVNSIHLQIYNNSTPAIDFTTVRVGILWDKNNNSVYDFATESIIKAGWFDTDGEILFFDFPLFTVKQRTDFNLLVLVIPTTGDGHFAMEINNSASIKSKGQVSTLGITPTGSFPMASAERWVIDT